MSIDILFLGGTSIDFIQDRQSKNVQLTFTASVGGSITNSAVIAGKLGINVALLSRIGKDPLASFAIKFLNSCNVNTKGIIQDSNIKTPIAIANIDKHGNSIYTFYKNTPKESIVPLENVPRQLLNTCKIFHFGSSFSYQKETYEEALKYVQYLKKRGVFISFDPNLRPYSIKDKKEAKNRVWTLLKLVDLAKLSEMDIAFLTGLKSPQRGLIELKKGLSCEIIITLGSKGCLTQRHLPSPPRGCPLLVKDTPEVGWVGSLTRIPSFKVKVADTIGAGDAFTAGFLYKLSKEGNKALSENIKPTLIFASAVSAIICTKYGSSQALKSLKQVETFLSKHAI